MPLRAAHETHGGVFISFYVFILKLLAAINLRCPKQNGRNEGMAWQKPLLLGGKFINFVHNY